MKRNADARALGSRERIAEVITEMLRENLGVRAPIELGSDLLADFQLDSIRLLTLIVEIENAFQICFDPGDEADLRTVADLVALVERRWHAAGHGSEVADD